jgi:hypothetical protein
MEIIPIEAFGLHVEIPFLTPQGLGTAKLDDFAARICEPEKGLSIRSEQVRLRKWDELFGFELIAQFFGDNGQLSRSADRVKLFVRNARTAGDWNIIHQTLTKFYNILEPDAKSVSTLSAHVHAKFPSTEERDAFLNQFSHNALISKPAALGYARIFDWEKDIRVLIEPSNVVPDAVFVAWDTQYANDQGDWESFIASLPTMMENAANFFELGFEPFRERV